MGSEDWTFERVWICFFPQSAGSFSFGFLTFFFPSQSDIISSNNVLQYFVSFDQDSQSAINDLSGKDGAVLQQIVPPS